jgi:hypothetical protein
MGPVETYLSEMRELHAARAGVKETTYYTALANLLDEAGKTLKPRVRCILQLQNRGAGNPDGGLFTADQFPKGSATPAGAGIPPAAPSKSSPPPTTPGSPPMARRSPSTGAAISRSWSPTTAISSWWAAIPKAARSSWNLSA